VEEGQRCILIIGGIQIFLPNSPGEANSSIVHEEITQQESEKEAMGPNDFKDNYIFDAGATEERQRTKTIKEEKILMSTPIGKEKNSEEFLAQWEKELKMLEDWLNNPEPEDGFQHIIM
jgi:hypothetical protein